MTFELNSKVTIGSFKPFRGINNVAIKKSVSEYLDSAILRLPLTARLRQEGEHKTVSVQTANQFERGDKIKIELGYDNELKTEFEGFISRINMKAPLEVECEGYAFQLRDKMINKSWKSTTTKEVLSFLIDGTDIVLGQVDDGELKNVSFFNVTAFKALGQLKRGIQAVNIWFDGNVVNVDKKYTFYTNRQNEGKADVFYRMGQNTIKADDLKRKKEGEAPFVVTVFNKVKDGSKKKAKYGKGTAEKEVQLQWVEDLRRLEEYAKTLYKGENAKGWEGSITTFLRPESRPGYKMSIKDDRYPQRNGDYLVESVTTKFGTNGATRDVKISIEL